MTETRYAAPIKATEMIRTGFSLANKNPALWLFGIFVMVPPIGPTIGLGGWDLKFGGRPLLGLIGFAFFLAMAAMRLIGSAGLVHGVVAAGRDEKMTARQVFTAGKAPFWKLVGLHFIWLGITMVIGIAIALVFAALRAILSVAGDTLSVVFAALLALATLTIMAGLAIGFMYAVRFVVLGKMTTFKAASSGASLAWNHKGVNARIALALGGIWLLATLVITAAGAVLTRIPLIGAVALFFLSLAANGLVGAAFHGTFTVAFGRLSSIEPVDESVTELSVENVEESSAASEEEKSE